MLRTERNTPIHLSYSAQMDRTAAITKLKEHEAELNPPAVAS